MTMAGMSMAMTKRTSYVIGQDGKVKLAYSDMNYAEHVNKTLAAVRGMAKK
jgi:peroxiredoxin Q/BCP